MSTVVLTLEGMNFGLLDQMGRALRGFADADDRRRIKVDYPAGAGIASLNTGTSSFDSTLREQLAAGNNVIGMGFSEGAQALSDWLDRNADRPDAPPADRLSFILLGNPQRRFGGKLGKGWDGKPLRPTRDDTQYRIIDIARRGDRWANADWWDRPPSKLEQLLGQGQHMFYGKVDLSKAKVRKIVGNTTYLVAE